MDHRGCVVEFNPAAERTFGYRSEDAIGREMAELIVPPDLRESHRRGLARYLSGGSPRVLDQRFEIEAVRADGTRFPVELAITRIDVPGPPLFTGYLRDITERRRAETELRESRARASSRRWVSCGWSGIDSSSLTSRRVVPRVTSSLRSNCSSRR